MKNMKKLLTLSLIAFFAGSVSAQDENELKNFRFGLKLSPSVNWYKPDGKIMSKNGAGVKFGGGLILEFRLAKVASIQTGLQIDLDGGKIKYNNGGYTTPGANTVSYYYSNADDKIVEYSSVPTAATPSAYTHYQLNERKFKVSYITIPLSLKLKTKEIGMMTYFGQFGVNNSFRWKAKADDKLSVLDAANFGALESKSNIDITKDVSFYTAALNFGAGAEMNLSGSTSLLIALNYNLGFTNVVKGDSDYLQKRTNDASTGNPSFGPMPQTIKTNAVVLTVGVLF
jgi:hypothetical protein